MEKQEFITVYLDDYVRMAYRELIDKIDLESEMKLIYNLYSLMDMYTEGSLKKYIDEEKIV